MAEKEINIDRILQQKERITQGAPCNVVANGRTYKVKQFGNWVRTKIHNLALEAKFIEQQTQEAMSLEKAQKLNRRLRAIPAKQAAYLLLGNWAMIKPLYAIKWRLLEMRTCEETFAINNAGLNDDDLGFFLLGFKIIKSQLEAFTKMVTESAEQKQSRQESAESMLDEDALPKSPEDSKSEARSRKAPTKKR